SVYDILQTSDSCYFLVGEGNNSNWGDGAITKMDQSGEIKWSKFYNESKCFYQALEISDDEIMIGGLSRLDQAPNSTTIDLFKINHNGDSLWLKQYGDIHIFSYLSLQNTFDGGYILASTRALWGEDDNIYLQKVDSMGNLEWFKLYGEEFYSDYATSVVQTSDSGYMMTGYKENSGLYLLKTNHYGDSLWEKSFNTDTTSTKGYCLIKTADDHYAVIGEELEQYYPGFSDLIFLKADQEGLVTGLNIERKRNEVIVAPNPNQGDFYVQLSEGDREIMIFDMNGVLVFKQKTSKYDGPTVKIANLKQGTYLIQIKSQKATRVAKVVVL
ncbi:MAG: T9SS type A sorting domain-containing protein, partial [Bacteroidales bacterium]|nr:T9SS type A sorting domain-containing protein [Bacteroidales bacterium]